jgi:hypothetical protein
MIDKKQFSFPNPFLHPFPEKEGVKIPAVEEIAGHILRELSPGREKEAFGGILLEGDRELLRTVLEEAPEEEFSFPQGEPDALILEERLRRLAPALACPLPLREGFSSSMVGAAVLLGGFFGWLAALVLGSGTAGASLAGGALGAGAAFWMAEKYRSSPEKSPSRTFRLLAFLGKALTAPFVQSRNSSSQVDRNALELQLRELLTQRYAFYRLALRGEYLFESLRQKNMEEKEHLPDLAPLGASLYALAGASQETLPEAVEELLRAAREAGFENLSLPADAGGGVREDLPRYWREELRDQYRTVGYLEPGEPVVVERRPVLYRGVLQEKGLLRRDKHAPGRSLA